MPTLKQKNFITEQEYLSGELVGELKHEYVDGQVYVMAGASVNHNTISVNIVTEFKVHLKKSPCRPFASDMKVKPLVIATVTRMWLLFVTIILLKTVMSLKHRKD